MAQTLPNGVVIPEQTERISSAGVQEMRTLGVSVDTQLGGVTWQQGRKSGQNDAFTLPPGVHTFGSTISAGNAANLPEAQPGTLIVESNAGEPVKVIRFHPHNRDYFWAVVSQNSTGAMREWVRYEPATGDPGPDPDPGAGGAFRGQDPGLMHRIQRDAFKRRRGGVIGTGGLPVVALRFDHGLVNFRDKVLHHLARLGLPSSMAMNAEQRRWDLAENAGVTPADLDGWATGYGVEIWNHSQTHRGADTFEDLHREIVQGKADLQAQTPSVPIEGWVIPGVTGDYGGFGSGRTMEAWDTVAGRLIAAHHAVSSSHTSGIMGPLTGDLSVLQNQNGIDSSDAATVTATIDDFADRGVGGLIIFLHPSQLDLEGKITTGDYVAVLERIAQLRDEGRIAVLTMGGVSVADQDRVHRPRHASLLPAMDSPVALSGTTSRSRTLTGGFNWVQGAPREVVVSLDVTTGGTVSVATGHAPAVEYTVEPGVQVLRRTVIIPLTATSLRVDVVAGTATGQVTQIRDYPI